MYIIHVHDCISQFNKDHRHAVNPMFFFLEAHGVHQLIQMHVVISVRKKRLCKDCFIMISLNRFYGAQPLIHSQDVNLE